MEGSTSKEKIALEDRTTYDDQLFTAEEAENSGQNSRTKCNCSPFSKRYMISILALLGFANVYALRVNLSVALVAMVTKTSTLDEEGKMEPAEFNWSSETQGIVLSSFFYGYIITQLPGGFLALKFGGKNLFGLGILSTAVLTLLTPVAARGSVGLLVALRVLIGLCEGIVFPANHAVWTKWAPPLERSKLATIAVSGAHIGTVIAMPLSGVLAQHLGWASVFYVFGCMGIVWAIVWFICEKFTCQGICIIVAGYTTNWLVAVVCLTLAVGGGGFAFSGFYVNHLDIAPPFAGILIGITNTVATLPGIISPLLTGVIVQHQSHASEWRIVFYLGGLIYFTGAIFYCIFSSGNKQTWAAGYSELTQMNEDNEEQMEFIES